MSETPISRRDYLAIHACDEEIDRIMPSTFGDIADELNRRGIIKYNRHTDDVCYAYKDYHVQMLRRLVRYEYADAMIRASECTQR